MLGIQCDRMVLRESEQAQDGRPLYLVHRVRVLNNRVSEAVTPELREHPAHHRDSVDQNAAVATDASTAFVATRGGKVLARTASNDQDQSARGENGRKVTKRRVSRGVVSFPKQVPNVARRSAVLGLSGQAGAERPAPFHRLGKVIVLFGEDREDQGRIDLVLSQGVNEDVHSDPRQTGAVKKADQRHWSGVRRRMPARRAMLHWCPIAWVRLRLELKCNCLVEAEPCTFGRNGA